MSLPLVDAVKARELNKAGQGYRGLKALLKNGQTVTVIKQNGDGKKAYYKIREDGPNSWICNDHLEKFL